MLPAATRFIAIGAMFIIAASCSLAIKSAAAPSAQPLSAAVSTEKTAAPAAARVRVAPARPTAPRPLSTSLRVDGYEYASATDIAVWLGLKGAWTEPQRKLTLTDKTNTANKVELNADSREAKVNGLRVFLGNPTVLRAEKLYVSRIDAERCLAPLLRPGFGVTPPPLPKIIVIDPGHGGSDPGGLNPRLGLMEKTFTLDVAFRLKSLLERSGYKVVLTRSGDRLPAPKAQDLLTRALIANREHADLFVSIHFNVVERDPQKTRGVEVYTFAPATQHAAEWWSELKKTDPDLMTTEEPGNRFDHWNVVLAGALHRELLETLKTDDRGKKIAHWGVLRPLNCPGVLVEPAVITNDAEARKIATPEFRQQIAGALAAGIRDYTATLDSLRPSAQPSSPTAGNPPASNIR